MSKQKYDRINILDRELRRRKKRNRLETYYPDEGPLRRELYVPHIKFFEATAKAFVLAILAANRIGKSEGIGGFLIALHLTGLYPEWWVGKRFLDGPNYVWACGTTNPKTAKTVQVKLLGEINDLGTGLIPGDLLDLDTKRMKSGVVNAIESIAIKHVSGRKIPLYFKSYAEGRESFESEDPEVIWLDEEPPLDVFGECVVRATPTSLGRDPGQVYCTFTPDEGMTETVMSFLPEGKLPDRDGLYSESGGKFIINASWDDAPHLSKEAKELLWAEIPPHQRDAKTKGIPQLGSGAVYPIDENAVIIDDIEIPVWYRRVFGFDHGWNWTAAAWLAIDPDTGMKYIYNVYKRGMAEPPIHAAAVNARGDWIPGVSDPTKATSSRDGQHLIGEYQELIPNLHKATKYPGSIEAGIFEVWKLISLGQLKVFKSCRTWLDEFRLYRRDKHGKVVPMNDHLMDCTRYAIMDGLQLACEMPDEDDYEDYDRVPVSNKRMSYVS